MKALVLGGTGYVGRRVTERLIAAGHEVTVVSRGQKKPAIEGRFEHLQLDRKDHESFESAMQARRFDCVIDNIAYTHEDALSSVRAFRGSAGRYLFTSSVAVYMRRQTLRPLREDDADLTVDLDPAKAEGGFHPSGRLDYAIGKRAVEREFMLNGADLPWTSLRAPIVVGPDDRTMRIWWFVQRLQDGGPLVVPHWGYERIFQVVTADALAEVFLQAAQNDSAACRAYNVAQPEILTAETWTDGLAAAVGTKAQCIRIPESLLAAVGLEGYAMPIAGRPFGHVLLDISAAREELGWAPEPYETWMSTTGQGCAAQPPEQDSAGYASRSQEIEAAFGYRAAIDEAQQELAAATGR